MIAKRADQSERYEVSDRERTGGRRDRQHSRPFPDRRTPIRATAAALAACALAGIAGAGELRACHVERAILDRLIDWIADRTIYDVSTLRSDPPAIVLCSHGEDIPYEGRNVIVDPDIDGLYDLENRRVLLTEPWDPTDPRDLSVLLHELIHDVQWTSREWRCIGEPEWEAYKLQEAWLAEHGVVAEFDWVAILLRSRCPRDIHP